MMPMQPQRAQVVAVRQFRSPQTTEAHVYTHIHNVKLTATPTPSSGGLRNNNREVCQILASEDLDPFRKARRK